jgi:hypothetical protein
MKDATRIRLARLSTNLAELAADLKRYSGLREGKGGGSEPVILHERTRRAARPLARRKVAPKPRALTEEEYGAALDKIDARYGFKEAEPEQRADAHLDEVDRRYGLA